MTDDTITKLGKLLSPGEGRDAVHIAVTPVISNWPYGLTAATLLAFVKDSQELVVPYEPSAKLVGIVDPYIQGYVLKGQRFWMFLMPATITSLRHVWTHPAFSEASATNPKEESKKWLREYIDKASYGDISLETVIAMALHGPTSYGGTDALCFGDEISGEITDEFWNHMEIVVGAPMKWRPTHFRCAC